jgi:hypothetical protein
MAWVPVTDPNEIAAAQAELSGGNNKFTAPDKTFLNEQRALSQAGRDSVTEYKNAAGAIDRFGTDAFKANIYDAAIPDETDGIFSGFRKRIVNKVGRVAGVIDDQGVDDFQTLKGLQAQRTLTAGAAQKGPQTEFDAARIALSEISPYKTMEANRRVIYNGTLKAALLARKADYYTTWANKYGLNGLDPQGRSVEAGWEQLNKNAMAAPMPGARRNAPAKGGAGPKRIRGDADYQKLPSGARFIDPEGVERIKP